MEPDQLDSIFETSCVSLLAVHLFHYLGLGSLQEKDWASLIATVANSFA